jgi:GNAT superfamily N-acetyltransferase
MTTGLKEPRLVSSVVRMPQTKTEVRPGIYSDVHGIKQTLMRALAESETPYPEPEDPYCLQRLMDLIAQHFVFVAVSDSRIVGAIVLDRAHWGWTRPTSESGRHLYNEHFWVDPAYRRGGTASKLLNLAEARADCEGLPLLLITSMLDGNTELKERFVSMHGFKRVGGTFYRSPKTVGG